MQESLLFTSDTDELWNGHIAEQIVGQELLGASERPNANIKFFFIVSIL